RRHAVLRQGARDHVSHERRIGVAKPTAFHEELIELRAQHAGLETASGLDRAIEGGAYEARRLVLDVLEQQEVAAGELALVVIRTGADVDAEEIRILLDLCAQRVSPGD